MNTEIKYRPAYALGIVTLNPNEGIRVDSGAMVSMSADMQIETKAQGGIFASLGRSILGGESFFQNTYRAGASGGEITVAPPLPGDMFTMELHGETLLMQSGAFVACSESIALDTKWTGAKTFFAKEGPIMLRASGTGTLIFASYGAIHERTLGTGEKYKLDTGHIVAFNDGMGFEVQRVGGLKSTFFSGEGLVVQMTGPGRILMQTRSEDAFLSWLIPHLPKSNSN
ncbi:MAG: TIGR00266 family protein [Anaerolineales bacterium]|nr:TIGR00266 family protein [Anaerolineales bacterium]